VTPGLARTADSTQPFPGSFQGAVTVKPLKTHHGKHRVIGSSSCNGAAAVKSRKTSLAAIVVSAGAWLQWGRGGEAAEDQAAGTDPTGQSGGFNGAAAVKPRKTASLEMQAQDRVMLQWGRGGEAAEDSRLI
jgi:hypothetical protein